MFSKKSLIAWAVLIAGLLVTVFAAQKVKQEIDRGAISQFENDSDLMALKLRERLESYELTLRGGASLYASLGSVSRLQWKVFVNTLQTSEVAPGVQGIGYSQLVPRDQLADHVAGVRGEGFSQYKVWPEGERDIYSAIVYLEPFEGRNVRAFGYDMYAEPIRRMAMQRARDTGKPSLTDKVQLVQEDGADVQAGTLMYVPVYQPNRPLNTVEERRNALAGWAYSPFRMKDMIAGAFKDWPKRIGEGFQLTVYGDAMETPANLLYSSKEGEQVAVMLPLVQRRSVDFYGHRWLLQLESNLQSVREGYRQVWLTLLGGAIISGLLFWLLRLLIDTQARAERIAERLTGDIKRRDELLRDSEFRWKFALEGSALGVWDWNIAEDTVLFSKRWKEMLGYTEQDIGTALDEWSTRLHPDDRDGALAAVQDYLDGRSDSYDNEHRLRCKDGSYKWIRDRGMVVSRAGDGKPLRMIGTQSDVTERKTMVADLQNSRAELLEAQRIAKLSNWRLDLATNQVVWSEALYRMLGLTPDASPPDFPEHRRLFTPESWERLSAAVDHTRKTGTLYELELEMSRANGSGGWMMARGEAMRDERGVIVGLRGVAADITERKHAEISIRKLSMLYAALSECNAAVARCTSLDELFERVCKVVVDLGGMTMAWIGLCDAATGQVAPSVSYGKGTDYLEGIQITVGADDPHGRGPTGTAIRENRVVWTGNFHTDPTTMPWQERAVAFGWRAAAAFPIRRSGSPVGVLTAYSTEVQWQDAETRTLLEKMSESVSYALDKLTLADKARVYEATLTESEQRFRTMVEQSIAGTFIIQDGKFIYVNPRLGQILGTVIGNGIVGHTLLEIVADKDRKMVEQQMQCLSDETVRSVDFVFTALRLDGTSVEVGVNIAQASYQNRSALIGLMQDISDRKVAEEQIRRYAKQLERVLMDTVKVATTLSEMRDAYTVGHEKRVAEIAVAIGEEMGVDQERLEGLKIGGYLHDVGKGAIPSEILAKPTRLNRVEMDLVKTHARAGYDVLKDVEFPWPVAQIALQHHERMDGSGYPQGLRGEAILLEARIIAVADVIESMASHRPYRPGLGIDKALAEIERGMGAQYDSVVANACLRLFREKNYTLPT